MSYFLKRIIIIFLCALVSGQAWSATVMCTYTVPGEVGQTFSLSPANVTLSGNIPDFTIIYSFNQIMVGITQGNCPGNPTLGTFITLTDLPSNKPPISYNGYTIYPTSTEGLGISINNWGVNMNPNAPVPVYPITLQTSTGVTSGWGGWLYIKLWKIPGKLLTNPAGGVLSFTGPTYHQGFVITKAGDSFINTDMSYSPPNSTTFWSSSSRTLIGSATFNLGTCELSGGDKTVQMGTYAYENNSEYSGWKDASFSIKCPNAYGYGGAATGSSTANNLTTITGTTLTANTLKNANLSITVVPRTQILTSTARGTPIGGTVALDGTGAKGYGVQLAWGNYATLGATPAKPVVFNTPVLASTLNSAYASGAYAIGAAMPSPVIQMGARYIRTSSDSGPGEANTSVEIIANYN